MSNTIESFPRTSRAARERAFVGLCIAMMASGAWAQISKPDSRGKVVDISGYSVEGRVQLEHQHFTRLVAPYIGLRRSAGDIERARSAVEQAYHDLGFCSVRVVLRRPVPQDGVVLFGIDELEAGRCPDAQVVVNAGAVRTELPVRSLRALRDEGVVKQRHDYSCGAASLATLLTYALNDPVDENALLRALLESLSPEELDALQRKGLSLFDLQQLAQKRGHKAQGFRVHQSQLGKLSRPVIVFIKPQGYEHFAVLKGLRGDRVHLADPSLGNVRMPLYRFLEMWADDSGRGVVFAVEKAAGDWPERYALQLADRADTPLEVLSAERLMAIGKPHPLLILNR